MNNYIRAVTLVVSALTISNAYGFSVNCQYSLPESPNRMYALKLSSTPSGKVSFVSEGNLNTSCEAAVNNDGNSVFLHDSNEGSGAHLYELVTLPLGFKHMSEFSGSVRLLSRVPSDLRVPVRPATDKDVYDLSCHAE